MYKFGFGLQPVIDGLAVSHSTLDVKFVSTKSDCMFQHRIWWGTWQHCSDGIHGHLDRWCTIARSENSRQEWGTFFSIHLVLQTIECAHATSHIQQSRDWSE